MKGINNEMRIPCRSAMSKNSIIVIQSFLKESDDILPVKENRSIQRDNPRNTISQRIRGLITSRLIMITDIITLLTFPNTIHQNRAMTQDY